LGLLARTDVIPAPKVHPAAMAASPTSADRPCTLFRVKDGLSFRYNGTPLQCDTSSDQAFVAVLDSASEPNLMNKHFADRHRIQYFKPRNPVTVKQVLGSEGSVPMEVRGEITCILNEGSVVKGTTYTPAACTFLVVDMGDSPMYDLLLGVSIINDRGAVPDSTLERVAYRPHKQAGDEDTLAQVPLICKGPLMYNTRCATAQYVICMAACSVRAPQSTSMQERPSAAAAKPVSKASMSKPAPAQPRSSATHQEHCMDAPSSQGRVRKLWWVWRALVAMLLCAAGLFTIARFVPPPRVPTVKISAMVRTHGHQVLSVLPGGPELMAMDAGYVKDPDLGVVFGNHPNMSLALRKQLHEEVSKRKDTAFAYDVGSLDCYNGPVGAFSIPLTHSDPIQSHKRPKSKVEREIMHEKCSAMLDAGIITPTPVGCQYVSETVQPSKKDADGNYTDRHFCVNLRKLNASTERDIYGMHVPEALFRDLQGAQYFTKIDLRAGYHQIPIVPDDQEKTTFCWANKLHMFLRKPFGARNATAHFQRIMDAEILRNNLTGSACSFVDDILTYSYTAEEHVQHVARALDMLINCNLKAHPDKTIVGAASVATCTMLH